MKNNLLKTMTVVLLSVLVSSCENPQGQSNTSTYQEPEYVENDAYSWNFNEKQGYKESMNFTVESQLTDCDVEVLLDGTPLTPLKRAIGDVKVLYDLDSEYPCHSDSVEHAYNEITFNNNVLGKLPSDNTNGIDVAFSSLYYGQNVFSLTIGQVYAYNKKYDMNQIHGGLNGGGDDFKIGNVRLQTASGQIIKPSKMVFYKPKDATSKNFVKREVQQVDDEFYFIGDGWGGSLSYDGNTNPRLDIPFKIDYYFDFNLPAFAKSYELNTKDYEDGLHTITLKDKGEVVLKNNVYFDNNNPKIDINLKDNDFVPSTFKVECKISDLTTNIVAKTILLDGKEALIDPLKVENISFSMAAYDFGQHNITMYGKDLAGNEIYDSVDFITRESSEVVSYDISNNNVTVNPKYNSTYTTSIYNAKALSYNEDLLVVNNLTNPEEKHSTFKVSVEDPNKDIYVSYKGETYEGERLSIEVYNPNTSSYERVTVANANQTINFKFNPNGYITNNSVEFKVRPIYTSNGSNKLLWSSDTQFLPKADFTDINYMYDSLMEYMVKEYQSNNMAYMVHTGDIVDDNPSYGASAIAEWEIATKSFEILDNANVPYGVNAGNHDVGSVLASLDYGYYGTYFGMDRFNDSDYYGGSLNNNECHYDLITIGKYDFIFLYIGFGVEAKEQTIQWANEVLQRYSHRNAVVATHGYLLPDGTMDPDAQGQIIYDEIVVPNDNVKFVFCGHNDGTAKVKKIVNENRYVYELLNCYQFVETKKYSVSHKINGMTCNGEAFIKSLTFEEVAEGTKVKCVTYSPVINSYVQPFGGDNFEIVVDLIASNRTLTTSHFKAYQSTGDAAYSSESLTFTYDFTSNSNYIIESLNNTKGYGITLI